MIKNKLFPKLPKNHTNVTTNYAITQQDEEKETKLHQEYPYYIEHEPYMGERIFKHFYK